MPEMDKPWIHDALCDVKGVALKAALTGLWGCERSLGPAVRGRLTLERTPAGFTASIAGCRVAVQVREDPRGLSLTFALPDGQGEFRGQAIAGAASIVGHWIQPPRVLTGDRMATPVTLIEERPGVWSGDVDPFDERLSLYVVVTKETDGGLTACIRNPERNIGRGAIFRVSADDGAIRFVSSPGSAEDPHGVYDPEADSLNLALPSLGLTLPLARRGRATASGFYPRGSAGNRYVYRPPVAARDGWAVSSLADAGIAEEPLVSLVQSIADTEPGQIATPCIQGLLIARHGRLVLEEYFHGFDRERPHDLRSASKTFASLLVGLAIEQGSLDGPDAPVYSLFPEYPGLLAADPRRGRMTIAHLMTMTSGLACDDYDDASPGNEERLQSQSEQPDWCRYTLGLPLANEPGTHYAYCSAAVNLLSGIVRNVTNTWLPDYFRRYVAEPLQMRGYHINLTPTGDAYGGGGMQLRPRDALKLGQLYLDGGRWNGRPVIGADWADRSTRPMVAIGDGSHDGYNWHCHEYTVGGRTYREYDASGNGGQLVMVFPELDLAVAVMAGNYGQYGIWRRFRDELVPQGIIPALVDR